MSIFTGACLGNPWNFTMFLFEIFSVLSDLLLEILLYTPVVLSSNGVLLPSNWSRLLLTGPSSSFETALFLSSESVDGSFSADNLVLLLRFSFGTSNNILQLHSLLWVVSYLCWWIRLDLLIISKTIENNLISKFWIR